MTIKQVVLLLFLTSGSLVLGASLCLRGDFDSQVRYLIANEMLSKDELHNISMTFLQLQDKLRTIWEGANLYVYGSLPTGLGTRSSDVDFYLQVPNYNDTADAHIVDEIIKLLSKEPELYSDIVPKLSKIVPMMTYYDLYLERYVDMSFRSRAGVENSKLIEYVFSLDERYLPFASIIKFWCKVHQLCGKGLLPNYASYLLVYYYLQQKNMAPTTLQLQEVAEPHVVHNWNANFGPITYKIDNHETLYELLGGFFKFYSQFNFADYCIVPYLGRAIAKNDYDNLETIPSEFSMYKNYLLNDSLIRPIKPHTDLCVQDIFEHNVNTVERVKSDSATIFKKHLAYGAKMFEKLPRDEFLRSILIKDVHNETMPDRGKENEVETNMIMNFHECPGRL